MFSKPFYTPIFDRRWVEDMLKKIAKEKKKKELRYEKITDSDISEDDKSVE